MPRSDHLALQVVLVALSTLLVVAAVGPVAASPAPVAACPPCSHGFESAAQEHGLDTDVRHSEATIRVHENGSATWTVRVVPTNESAMDRLAGNPELASAVAGDSFGVRYGGGIEHELLTAGVRDGAFEMRYRTHDVAHEGVLGTQVVTYFRDSPGAYVYTDLGADELTVVGQPGTTVARGFGEVDGPRMTATELPGVRDGPFVVFAPEGSAAPEVLGWLAVLGALGGVIVRNVLLFVVVPGGVFLGGMAAIRQFTDASTAWNPARLGGAVAAGGALLLGGTLLAEGDALPAVTGNLLVGGLAGCVLLVLGAAVAVPDARRHLTPGRLVAGGIVAGIIVVAAADAALGSNTFHTALGLGVALLPATVALGRVDARCVRGKGSRPRWPFAGLAVVVLGVLALVAPITALGGTLFILLPMLLTVAALAGVVASIVLYLLGTASVTAEAA